MTDTPDQPAERRVDLAHKFSVLSERLDEKIAEIRTEQRAVLKDLVDEQRVTLTRVQEDQAVVRSKLDTNTQLTQEVRDILTTFKMLGSFAKWTGAIVAAVAGAWAAIKGLKL